MVEGAWKNIRYNFLAESLRSLLPHWLVNSFWHLPRAVLANLYWGFPARQLFVIGVTGTDGKTTTATLICEILNKAGKKTALISTVGAEIGSKKIPTGLHVTSPDSFVLQKLINRVVEQGCSYLVLEATSHGLTQNRLWGIDFDIGVVTNVTEEHLDYHGSFNHYLGAKAKLFKKAKIAILNKDDRSFSYLKAHRKPGAKLITYGIKQEADFMPQKCKFKTQLPGKYNQYNCLAAIAVAGTIGVGRKEILSAITQFKGVKGRMEKIDLGQDFQVFVDFAHTPNALFNVLKTLQNSKLIVVFGCAGLRDKSKRPKMGKIAAQLANFIVLTAEDPRTEDVNLIIDQIARGCLAGGAVEASKSAEVNSRLCQPGKKSFFFRIPDRAEAIRFAVGKLAQPEDIVVITGKGHEQSMCYGRKELPWSDQQEVKKTLK